MSPHVTFIHIDCWTVFYSVYLLGINASCLSGGSADGPGVPGNPEPGGGGGGGDGGGDTGNTAVSPARGGKLSK